MTSYAKNTSVPIHKTQADIQSTLMRYGADKFGYFQEGSASHIMFEYNRLMITMSVALPEKDEFSKTPNGRNRSKDQIEREFSQVVKQRWRALLLVVKAKLEAVESGISTVEQEFLAFIRMPDGKTIGDHVIGGLQKAASEGKLPTMISQFSSSIE